MPRKHMRLEILVVKPIINEYVLLIRSWILDENFVLVFNAMIVSTRLYHVFCDKKFMWLIQGNERNL
jgi:hypothetical protein